MAYVMAPRYSERKREAERARYVARRLAKAQERLCANCGRPVPVELDLRRKTCSEQCRRERDKAIASAYYEKRIGGARRGTVESRERLSTAAKKRWTDGVTFADRSCRACGEQFRPGSGSQRYCSEACRRFRNMSLRYGTPASELRVLFDSQNGRCALCGEHKKGWSAMTARKDALVIDHCHSTGKVRGFLCGDCNTALGRFNDDPALLRRAIAYLERNSSL